MVKWFIVLLYYASSASAIFIFLDWVTQYYRKQHFEYYTPAYITIGFIFLWVIATVRLRLSFKADLLLVLVCISVLALLIPPSTFITQTDFDPRVVNYYYWHGDGFKKEVLYLKVHTSRGVFMLGDYLALECKGIYGWCDYADDRYDAMMEDERYNKYRVKPSTPTPTPIPTRKPRR